MAATKSKARNESDEVDDLLDELGSDGEDVDLLDEIEEDDAEGWVPDEPGEGIQGVVYKVGETRSDFSDPGEDDHMAPTIWLETPDGTRVRIIGYGTVLRREILDADPQPGDTFAVKYFGEKKIRKGKWAGKNYKHFGVKVRRA